MLKSKTELIFVKLGGSLITDKTKPKTPNIPIIVDLVRQIKEVLEINPNLKIILGNGSGSFGHFEAVNFNIKNGIDSEEKKYGFCIVNDTASQINKIVVKEFLNQHINVVSISPSSMSYASSGKLKKIFIDPIVNFLSLGLIPIIYGDIVYDIKKGSKIFSVESTFSNIIDNLPKKYKVIQIIHIGVVEGVYSKEKIISKITPDEIKDLPKIFNKTEGYDVTGGMYHKVTTSLKYAKKGINSYIIGGKIKDNLKNLLLNKNYIGTLISNK